MRRKAVAFAPLGHVLSFGSKRKAFTCFPILQNRMGRFAVTFYIVWYIKRLLDRFCMELLLEIWILLKFVWKGSSLHFHFSIFCKFSSSSSPCCCCCCSFHPSYYIWADSIDCLTLITLQVYYLLWMPSRIYEPNVFVMVWWSAHSAAFWDDLGLIPTKAWMYKIPSFCFFWFTGLAKQFGREICNHQ